MRELTDNEARFFRSAGYLKLDWHFEAEVMEAVTASLDTLLDKEVAPLKRDRNGNIVKLYDLYSRDALFREIYTSDLIVKPLGSLLGPNIEFLRNRHNHASIISHQARENRFHRDILHWSRPTVSVLVYPQDTRIDNGCTWLIPCSQYFEFTPPSDSASHGGTWLDEFSMYSGYEVQAVPVPMEKGGILIFDSLAFHSPGINTTDVVRYALTAAYHASDELTKLHSDEERVLVAGIRMYRGNDLNWQK